MTEALETTSVQRADDTPVENFRPGFARRIVRTGRLMTVVLDVQGGPWPQPDPMHSHPHEQISYIAAGELIFLAADQPPQRLRAGDLFAVPPGVPHSIHLLSPTARLVDTFHPIREDFL
jgi:mannose-6-phosphate isomerase-like protein (cupin superfamily)